MMVCENCGEEADEFFHVVDSDPAVGYSSTLCLCRRCLRDGRAARIIEREAEMEFHFYNPSKEVAW